MYKHVGLIGRSYKVNLHGKIGEYGQGRLIIKVNLHGNIGEYRQGRIYIYLILVHV